MTAEEQEILNELIEALRIMVDDCPCKYGGFDGTITNQPCDKCDKAIASITKAKKGDLL